jgi:hypothetical protein
MSQRFSCRVDARYSQLHSRPMSRIPSLSSNNFLKKTTKGYVLKSNAQNPFPTGYKPKLNVTNELNQTLASQFMQLIGILRWAVEIGRIDIYLKTLLLSQYQANPRFKHLKAAYHIFAYLKKHLDMGNLLLIPMLLTPTNLSFIPMLTGQTFMGTFPRNCYLICPNRGKIR